MLQNLNSQAAYCLQRANENRLKAEQVDAEHRERYLEMEWRWHYLAESHARFGNPLKQCEDKLPG
jgi:predicted kinase